jgi:hypothetical protein
VRWLLVLLVLMLQKLLLVLQIILPWNLSAV